MLKLAINQLKLFKPKKAFIEQFWIRFESCFIWSASQTNLINGITGLKMASLVSGVFLLQDSIPKNILTKVHSFFKTVSARSSVYENKVLFTKPFQASPSWHQLKTLFSQTEKTLFAKWMDFRCILCGFMHSLHKKSWLNGNFWAATSSQSRLLWSSELK